MPAFLEQCLTDARALEAAIDTEPPSGRHRAYGMSTKLCQCQCAGFCLSLLGWLCSLAATVLPQWLTKNSDLLQSEIFFVGMWEACVAQDEGPVQCKAYDSLLGLPDDIQLTRILMCVSVALGLLALLFSLSGLDSITCCSDQETTKGRLAVSGGVSFLLAGVTTLAPVSYMAHLTVVNFWDTAVPEFVPRWEFGPALFVGWLGGFLLVFGGLLLITSQCCFRKSEGNLQLQPLPVKRALWHKTEYV
ncbi:putative claudin-24 [Chiloscyllium plagiosum]|uniref:putative claudin-24 n=1 Tax=Chiloscyllium plagiosum TaxID=36176 RepID=UPI001CB834B4|nr:putative claudin-24 [Chiloscyllium plagiosum]XP_043556386.1 putative claudin-24 [Chiloscyllium plagiosum]